MEEKIAHTKKTLRTDHFIEKENNGNTLMVLSISFDEADLEN